jgi:Fe-S oxidoreductase
MRMETVAPLREVIDAIKASGGGGGIWMKTPKWERLSDLRVKQAVDVGAEVLVTACRYCITNFTDSCLSLKDRQTIEVKDITEIVEEVI